MLSTFLSGCQNQCFINYGWNDNSNDDDNSDDKDDPKTYSYKRGLPPCSGIAWKKTFLEHVTLLSLVTYIAVAYSNLMIHPFSVLELHDA